jgi:multiple sugar transport system permease protein
MVYTALRNVDTIGYDHGWAGWANFRRLMREPDLGTVLQHTVVWVLAVVLFTVIISLALAMLFNQRFPGRRVTRWALIAPWAVSLFSSAVVFRWMLAPGSGLINVFLHDIGPLGDNMPSSAGAAWLGRPTSAFVWMIGVAIFVSVPFTTYVILAGLQTIPGDVYEAARVDGAGPIRAYASITLPLLRPALTVAALINIINVFNSFPIIPSPNSPSHFAHTV